MLTISLRVLQASLAAGLLLFFPVSSHAKGACAAPATPIARIQGTGEASSLTGQWLTVEAVVSGVFSGEDRWRGFYLLEDPADQDDSRASSEGLFVYAPDLSPSVGDRLRLRGRVKEFHGLTELTAVSLEAQCGRGDSLPGPVPLTDRPWDSQGFESLESMVVSAGPLVIVDSYHWLRYGSLTLLPERPVHPLEAPPSPVLHLDDGSRSRGLAQPPHTLQPHPGKRPPRLGDRVRGARAVLDYRFGAWRLQPLEPFHWDAANPRPSPPDSPQAGSIRVAAFNLRNYFNGDGRGGGFPTARGAASRAAWKHQTARLVSAIRGLKADILALAELENDGDTARPAGSDLADALGGDWRWVAPPEGRLGQDEIAVGLLYRARRAVPEAAPQAPPDSALGPGNRVPLAQRFRAVAGGGSLVVVANHFRSKRCRPADSDGTTSCGAGRRLAGAQGLAEWVEARFAGEAVVLAGDFNSYPGEPALKALAAQGFRRMAPAGGRGEDYTYVYRGLAGALDHLLYNARAAAYQPRGDTWAINADEWWGLAERKDVQGPWRSSDHDPVFADLMLSSEPP